MKLIAEKLGKSDKMDRLRYVRADGSKTDAQMPRQGILPHDLVHYVVESSLGLREGFTGLVARGMDVQFNMDGAAKPGGLQAGTEAMQVEAIVEALQSQLWSGQFSAEDFFEGVRAACDAHNQPVFIFTDPQAGQRMYDAVLALNAQWVAVPFHGSLTLEFSV
ncbi:MAG: hypothetical protein ACJ8GW_12965 [Massilia sp.]